MTAIGIHFEIVWHDADLLEFLVTAASGAFSGRTRIFMGHTEAAHFVRDLTGFPATRTDRREFRFQSSEQGNRVDLTFAGPGVHVDIVDAGDSGQSAHVIIELEAAAIDRFVLQFGSIIRQRAGESFLGGH